MGGIEERVHHAPPAWESALCTWSLLPICRIFPIWYLSSLSCQRLSQLLPDPVPDSKCQKVQGKLSLESQIRRHMCGMSTVSTLILQHAKLRGDSSLCVLCVKHRPRRIAIPTPCLWCSNGYSAASFATERIPWSPVGALTRGGRTPGRKGCAPLLFSLHFTHITVQSQ